MKRLKTALMNRNDIVSGRIIINILEKADPDGLVHGLAVAEIATIIASESGLDAKSTSEVWLAALLHDIGKLGVPSDILRKKNLSRRETAYVQRHVTIGKIFVDRFFDGGALGRTIEAHHERYDGSGYPRGLKEKDIPWDARVIAIADYYDSARSAGWLLSHRSHEAVMREIEDLSGVAFDPVLVRTALARSIDIQVQHRSVRGQTPSQLRKLL